MIAALLLAVQVGAAWNPVPPTGTVVYTLETRVGTQPKRESLPEFPAVAIRMRVEERATPQGTSVAYDRHVTTVSTVVEGPQDEGAKLMADLFEDFKERRARVVTDRLGRVLSSSDKEDDPLTSLGRLELNYARPERLPAVGEVWKAPYGPPSETLPILATYRVTARRPLPSGDTAVVADLSLALDVSGPALGSEAEPIVATQRGSFVALSARDGRPLLARIVMSEEREGFSPLTTVVRREGAKGLDDLLGPVKAGG